MRVTVDGALVLDDPGYADDVEESALLRLATLSMPSAYSVSAGNRRDVVAEDELAMRIDAEVTSLRRQIAIRIAWLARRLRRELAI